MTESVPFGGLIGPRRFQIKGGGISFEAGSDSGIAF